MWKSSSLSPEGMGQNALFAVQEMIVTLNDFDEMEEDHDNLESNNWCLWLCHRWVGQVSRFCDFNDADEVDLGAAVQKEFLSWLTWH